MNVKKNKTYDVVILRSLLKNLSSPKHTFSHRFLKDEAFQVFAKSLTNVEYF